MDAEGVLVNLRRGTVEHCVLALLSGQSLYALDVVRQLSALQLLTSEGTVYPLLSRLRRDGLVDSSWSDSPAGPPRRYYSLSPAGALALGDFTRQWQQFRDAVDKLLEQAA